MERAGTRGELKWGMRGGLSSFADKAPASDDVILHSSSRRRANASNSEYVHSSSSAFDDIRKFGPIVNWIGGPKRRYRVKTSEAGKKYGAVTRSVL